MLADQGGFHEYSTLRREDHGSSFHVAVAGHHDGVRDPGLGMNCCLPGRRCRSTLFLDLDVNRNLAAEAALRCAGNTVAGEEGLVENESVGHRLLASLASGLELPKRVLGTAVYWDPTGFGLFLDLALELERQSLARHGVGVAYVRDGQVAWPERENLSAGFHKGLAEERAVEPSALGTVDTEIWC